MNYWIGVVGSKISYERFQAPPYWFCLPQSCEVGDKVAMYSSRQASGVKSGVFGFFNIATKDEAQNEHCKNYGIFSGSGERPIYVTLNLTDYLSQSISYQHLKSNPSIKHSQFVKRNFQATYFKISANEYATIESLSI